MTGRRPAVVAIAFLFAFIEVVSCSHFRGGSMTWRAVEVNNKMEVEISYQLAYQIDTTEGWDNDCTREKVAAQQKVDGDYKKIEVQHLDGTKVSSVEEPRTTYYCTERHEAADYPSDISSSWIIGENKQIVELPDNLMKFNFLWHSCCWVTMQNYVEPKDWYFLMSVNLVPRSDTGAINHPPQTTGIPVKVISRGCDMTYITIPTSDADGDTVRCRWVRKTQNECNANCGGDSSIWTLEMTARGCRLVVNPSQASPGWYGVPIMLEDFSGKSGSPLSRVPFQFMLKIVDKATCQRPEIVSPPPDTCLVLPVEEEYSLTLTARAVTSDTSIRDIMTSGLIGMHKSAVQPVPGIPQEYYVTVTWTPPESERGRSSTLCFQPEDSEGFQGEMHCIDLYVGASPPPVPDPMKSFPSEGLQIDFKRTNFFIMFDSLIRRPKTRSEIRFLHASDGSLVYSLPVEPTLADEAVVYYPDFILFAVPVGLFEPNMRYRIELPRGLARGKRVCGVPSKAASWDFSGGENGTTPPINERTALSPECYGTYMQIYIPKLIVPYEDPTNVYFREPECFARLHNATHFLMRTDYQFCGTNILPRDGNFALVTNDIRIIEKTIPESESVTRTGSLLIHVVCRISNDRTTFVSLDTDIPLDKEVTVEAEASYNYTLVMYEDGSYSRPYGYSTYPLHAPVRERLFFEVAAAGSVGRRRSVYLRSCMATPSPNPHDRLSYQFVENGCPVDETVEFGPVSQTAIRFSIKSFAFLHHFLSDSIMFHCDVRIMKTKDLPQCQAKRRRRSADPGIMDGQWKVTE